MEIIKLKKTCDIKKLQILRYLQFKPVYFLENVPLAGYYSKLINTYKGSYTFFFTFLTFIFSSILHSCI